MTSESDVAKSRGFLYHWLISLRENTRFAFTAVRGHKLRSALTVLGIVIGVMTVIAMVSIIEGFNQTMTAEFEQFGATLVQFQKWDQDFGPGNPEREHEMRLRKELTYEDAVALKRLVPSMKAVSAERYWFGGPNRQGPPDVKYAANIATPDTVAGVNEDYPAANNQFIGEGRFITANDMRHASDVVVLGSSIAETLFPFSDPLGKRVTIRGNTYLVVGVMQNSGSTFFENAGTHVFLPLSTYDKRFPWIKKENGVNIATVPWRPEWVDKIREEGTAVMRARRKVPFNKPNDFGIRTSEAQIRNFRQITGGITLAMIFISSIALLVGGVGVMNIMLVSVTERTREIGVRKAIGAVRRDIITQFLTEAMTLTGIGGLLGISVGLGIAAIVRKISPVPAITPLWSIVLGFGVSVSIGLFFGIYPAYKAAKLDPIEALRYE